MRVTRNPELASQKLAQIWESRESQSERSNKPGTYHVSEVIHCLRKAWLKRKHGEVITPVQHLTFLIGDAYHQLLEKFTDVTELELERDGIVGTLDGLFVKDDELVILEGKSTRKSSKNGIQDMDSWFAQNLAYAKLANALRSQIEVVWLNGNYAPPTPQFDVFEVEYNQEAVDNNWEQVVVRKGLLDSAIAADAMPSTRWRFAWECRYCPFWEEHCSDEVKRYSNKDPMEG